MEKLSNKRYNQLRQYYSDEEILKLVEYWGETTCEKGYVIVDWEGTGLACIQRVDELRVFEDDSIAITQAKKDGVRLIPIHELPKGLPDDMCTDGWLDNLYNRINLKKYVGNVQGL